MLVMYSRFHNSAAGTLAAINEGGRFSMPRNPNDSEGLKKRGNDLFQVTRLLVFTLAQISRPGLIPNCAKLIS